jgi:hypothetical protein
MDVKVSTKFQINTSTNGLEKCTQSDMGMDGQTDGLTDGRTDGQMDRRTDGQTEQPINQRTSGPTNEVSYRGA